MTSQRGPSHDSSYMLRKPKRRGKSHHQLLHRCQELQEKLRIQVEVSQDLVKELQEVRESGDPDQLIHRNKELLEEINEMRSELVDHRFNSVILSGMLTEELILIDDMHDLGFSGLTTRELFQEMLDEIAKLRKLNGFTPRQLKTLLEKRNAITKRENAKVTYDLPPIPATVVEERVPFPTVNVGAVVGSAIALAYCPVSGSYTNGASKDLLMGYLKASVGELLNIPVTGEEMTQAELEDKIAPVMNQLIELEDEITEQAKLYRLQN